MDRPDAGRAQLFRVLDFTTAVWPLLLAADMPFPLAYCASPAGHVLGFAALAGGASGRARFLGFGGSPVQHH